jgi:hypothetical protein
LSAQFLQHTLGWSIAGFYNYATLYHDPAIDPRACVWVDLDIYDPACCSIGHHILRPAPTPAAADPNAGGQNRRPIPARSTIGCMKSPSFGRRAVRRPGLSGIFLRKRQEQGCGISAKA